MYFRVNFGKSSLLPSQQIPFLGVVFNSAQTMAWLSQEHTLKIRSMVASFRAGSYNPFKRFQKLLCLMAAASSVILLGLLHMHPALVEGPCPNSCVAHRLTHSQIHPQLC